MMVIINEPKTMSHSLQASITRSCKKQVTLAIMECKHEDTSCIETFWRLFNEAFKKTKQHCGQVLANRVEHRHGRIKFCRT